MVSNKVYFICGDGDDQILYRSAFRDIHGDYSVVYFDDAESALGALRTEREQPFLIIADVVQLGMSGLELRKIIDTTPILKERRMPFVFLADNIHKEKLADIDELQTHGFFAKPDTYKALVSQIEMIVRYWHTHIDSNHHEGG
jgi:CheY-like chemotaxis protein